MSGWLLPLTAGTRERSTEERSEGGDLVSENQDLAEYGVASHPRKGWLLTERSREILLFLLGLGLTLLASECNHTTSTPVAVTASSRSNSPATGPLRVLASNPRYFTNDGVHVVFLAGSHTWTNFQDKGTTDPPPAFDYNRYISFLVSHNMNFFRLWEWTLSNGGTANQQYEPYVGPYWPWQRIGPGTANDGKLKIDFTQFDQNYFDRMRQRIIQAGQNGIYVSVMLFDAFEFQYDVNSADGNPFENADNVNGISCGGTCPIDFSVAPSAGAWAIEQAYIRKVIDAVNDLDNVLYEVANEPPSPTADTWQAQVISYVKSYEATKPKQHPVGMNQGSGGTDATLYASAADWVSPRVPLPPSNVTTKVLVNDTDHNCYYTCLLGLGKTGQIEWAWENFTNGYNLLFMDPYLVQWTGRNSPSGTCSGGQCTVVDPYWDVIRNALGETRAYAQMMDLAAMTPQGRLSTSGFCLANPGSEYLIYQPGARGWKSYLLWLRRTFAVDLIAGTYRYEWYDPSVGAITARGLITVKGGNQSFTAPFSGQAVLYLKAR
jgi:hypothetical protein